MFPTVRKTMLGYNESEVDAFLEEARRAYDLAGNETGDITTIQRDSNWIRQASFQLGKGGYSPGHVDAALERLEEAFATRERERIVRARGEDHWYGLARQKAREILQALEQPHGKRFRGAGAFNEGYAKGDVDAFCDQIVQYFRSGSALSVHEVRSVVFRTKRGGYEETQVDLLLDSVVEVMLAVK